MEKYAALDLLFETSLRHLYQAEKAISENLIVLADTASLPALKEAFQMHKEETHKQIRRLETIFNRLNMDVKATKLQGLPKTIDQAKEFLKSLAEMNFTDRSKGIEGILSEGKELLRHFANTDALTIALISAAQKVESFEISCYNFLCLFGDRYENKEITSLLKESLNEEVKMQERLAEFAKSQLQTLSLSHR